MLSWLLPTIPLWYFVDPSVDLLVKREDMK
jgi:hypothetical protein